VISIKKLISIAVIAVVLTISLLSGSALVSAAVGPAPNSGDGMPSGNQYIQPVTPGVGPAPNAGDGVSDGSGF